MPFSSLVVRYQSAGMIPPPYTHFYTLDVRPVGQKQLGVEFAIEYTDREALDEEDITGEGFTLDDNFSWSGRLGAAWAAVVGHWVADTELQPFDENALGEDNDYLEVHLTRTDREPQVGTPADAETFLYVAQELIQAIYEAGGKEKPFELIYLDYNRNGDAEVRINASFAERTVRVTKRRNRHDETQSLSWESLKDVMAAVYSHDYNPDDSLPKPPKRDGRYLNLGGDEWYDVSALPNVYRALEQL